jgi:MFS family permease
MIGRKRTVVCGAAAGVVALAFYALGGTYLGLIVGAIFEGLGRAFYSGNNDALLYDTLAEMEQRDAFQTFLGKTASMYQIALAISAVIGSLIAAVSFEAVMVISIVPMALALLVSLRLVEPRAHTRATSNVYAHLAMALRLFIRNPRLRTLSVAGVVSNAVGESSWLFRSTFIAALWPVWAIGIYQLMANAAAAVSFYFAGRIIRRFGEYRLLVGGALFSQATNLFALLIPTIASPAIMSVNAILFGASTVAKQSLIQREFSDEQRATMGSLDSFAGSIVFAAFSFLLGALADRIGVIPALVVTVALSVVPMLMYWRLLRPRAGMRQPAANGESAAGTA